MRRVAVTFVVSVGLLCVCLLSGASSAVAQGQLEDPVTFEVNANLEESARVARELREALDRIESARAALEGRRAEVTRDSGSPEEAASEARIVNGVLTIGFPSTGALLHGASADSAGSHCTGTLIGCRTFLTANHCVERDRRPSRYHVYLQHGGIFAVDRVSPQHADYRFPHADLAVLRLAEAVGGVAPTRLNGDRIEHGSGGTIVGFGRSGGFRGDYGIKRTGRVTTAACSRPETSLLCWSFDAPVGAPGEDSNTCNADSGGPLFVGAGAAARVAGVTSGGTRSSCLAGDNSYDVDVRQFSDWIREQAGDDLDAESCGDLPVVGGGAAQYFGDAGELAAGASIRYRLALPAEVAVLRVAVNGEDTGATNLDLSVDPPAGSTSPGCSRDGSGVYNFCELEPDVAGDWLIAITQKGSSGGVYQVVATVIGGP